jgi:hypothetical protein
MKLIRTFLLFSLFGFFGAAVAGGQELVQESIANWSAPATWTPTMAVGLHTLSNITSPLPFIGVTPCRVADTRGNGFTGAYGPPSLVANATRSFTIRGQCGIPVTAAAVSLNFTALNVSGAGDLRVFPAGGSVPLVSTLDYNANTPSIANAAIVAMGTGGAVTVQADAVSIDLIIDVNGYYAPAGVGSSNTFLGLNAGNFTMTGDGNTAFGYYALINNGTGGDNTAIGMEALNANSTGGSNTAVGANALLTNTMGSNNTATGESTLLANTTGSNNTATGISALQDNSTGSYNTASGWHALLSNDVGDANTAFGGAALQNNNNVQGGNTAIGYAALVSSTGSANIGIGRGAGVNLVTGAHNIYIANAGVNGESNTIRIGDPSFQDGGTIIEGISGLTATGGAPVYVTGGGRLGTNTASSRRFKQDIRDIAGESDRLMRLSPVAFRYKPEFDPTGVTQYGLIAEEVAEVFPDLVTLDREGRPEGVRYHLITPLLLNEVQKQSRSLETQKNTIEQQKVTIDAQQAEIEGLKARMSKLEARLIAESGR